MRIEDVWRELETEARTRIPHRWLTRLARPDPGTLLIVAVDDATCARTLLLPWVPSAFPPRHRLPAVNGLDLFRITLDDIEYLAVRLRDASASEVFSALAEDIAARVAGQPTPAGTVSTALERIRRWQQFLSASVGLSPDAQRGLWAELHVLLTHMLPTLGAGAAVGAWHAPIAAHQDFQMGTGAVEVKCAAAKEPQTVHVTSERQLDERGVGHLFLHVVIVDERDVPSVTDSSTDTLPGLVRELRAVVSEDAAASTLFEDRLLEAGWVDGRAALYCTRRWSVRRETSFAVTIGFPRLTEDSLPSGIGHVSYELDLAACQRYSIPTERMMFVLAANNQEAHGNRE